MQTHPQIYQTIFIIWHNYKLFWCWELRYNFWEITEFLFTIISWAPQPQDCMGHSSCIMRIRFVSSCGPCRGFSWHRYTEIQLQHTQWIQWYDRTGRMRKIICNNIYVKTYQKEHFSWIFIWSWPRKKKCLFLITRPKKVDLDRTGWIQNLFYFEIFFFDFPLTNPRCLVDDLFLITCVLSKTSIST